MFQVITVNLSHDTTSADIAHGAVDVGELTGDELAALLERFRRLDPVQNHDADPQLLITTSAGKFRIRTGQGKLFLDNARDSSKPYAELTAEEIIRQLGRTLTPAGPEVAGEGSVKVRATTPNRAIAAAILIAGLALNGYTLYSVSYTESVNEKVAVAPVTDPAEISAHQQDVVGTFATGDQPGDRTITTELSGKITFDEIGTHTAYANSDTFRLGRLGKNYCLTTIESGVVEVRSIDTLVYYRDVYRRTK